MQLGKILLREGIIDSETLDRAVEIQRKWNSPLGTILMALGAVNSLEIARALSIQYDLPYRDPNGKLPDRRLLDRVVAAVGEKFLRENLILPLDEENDRILAVTARPNDRDMLARFAASIGRELILFVASERDMNRALASLFRDAYIDESVMGLFYRNPEESAVETFTTSQLVAAYLLLSLLLLGFWLLPGETGTALFSVVNLFYAFSILFKFAASFVGARTEILRQVTEEEVAALADDELPVYTILLPMYREPAVAKKLVSSLTALDYPTSRLDVKFLLEEDDAETLAAVRAARPPANFEILRVPFSKPKTKPKACNYGLLFAKGEFLTIFDAEDAPEPDQLKKAVVAFRKEGAELVCVQAALNYFNADQNFLTRMFTLEYSYWFDYMLPGVEGLRLPIPLGGTSNHFRTDVLRSLGGWDPFNVTEDADLGVRASAHKMRVATINATTFEEANSKVGNWLRQRSRWIKGYMQTWLVHMRHPFRLFRRIGPRAFLGFQLMIGGTFLTFLINPILWLLFILWLIADPSWMRNLFPLWLLYISHANLILGNALAIVMNMLAVFRRRYFELAPFALLNPFYWLLHSFAAYKALWQLITNPFYWEKTTHGLAAHK